jgi:hypothetical protein
MVRFWFLLAGEEDEERFRLEPRNASTVWRASEKYFDR